MINEQGELQWRASLEISKDKVSKFWFHLTVPNDAITSANQFYGINSNVEKYIEAVKTHAPSVTTRCQYRHKTATTQRPIRRYLSTCGYCSSCWSQECRHQTLFLRVFRPEWNAICSVSEEVCGRSPYNITQGSAVDSRDLLT